MNRLILALAFIGLLSTSVTSQIFINEILAGNQNDLQDDFFDNDDWLELYYSAPAGQPAVVNLAGYYLTDNPNNLTKWEIPSTNAGLTTIVNGQHLLFWIDNDIDQGEDHVGFKFTIEGESIYLVAPDTVTVIDSVTFPMQQPDISFGRSCDGCPDWVFFNNTTPDDPNMEIVQPAEVLFINEVLALNSTNVTDEMDEHEPWFEIYNPNDFQVNLAGYTISDGSTDYVIPNTNPTKTTVLGLGHFIFWCDGETEEGENHFPIALTAGGGTLTLTSPDGLTEVDVFTYPPASTDVSWGRVSDGNATGTTFNIPTPRVTNQLIIIQPQELYINELMADNVTDTIDNALQSEDWLELYNPNSFPVNLAGYFLSDNPDNPMKFQIPVDVLDSAIIPAGGWLLFWADEDGSQGWNHLNFKLNNAGEEVTLYSPDGFTVADQVEYGVQYDDLSYGRQTDGSSNWILFEGTTPEYSNNQGTVDVLEKELEKMSIYPNPLSSGPLYIGYNGIVRIYNAQGKLELTEKVNFNFIDVSSLEEGIHFIVSDLGTMNKVIINR